MRIRFAQEDQLARDDRVQRTKMYELEDGTWKLVQYSWPASDIKVESPTGKVYIRDGFSGGWLTPLPPTNPHALGVVSRNEIPKQIRDEVKYIADERNKWRGGDPDLETEASARSMFKDEVFHEVALDRLGNRMAWELVVSLDDLPERFQVRNEGTWGAGSIWSLIRYKWDAAGHMPSAHPMLSENKISFMFDDELEGNMFRQWLNMAVRDIVHGWKGGDPQREARLRFAQHIIEPEEMNRLLLEDHGEPLMEWPELDAAVYKDPRWEDERALPGEIRWVDDFYADRWWDKKINVRVGIKWYWPFITKEYEPGMPVQPINLKWQGVVWESGGRIPPEVPEEVVRWVDDFYKGQKGWQGGDPHLET